MSTLSALKALKAERKKLDKAIRILEGPQEKTKRKYERKNKTKRTMSATARKRIGDAARKRWAAWKKANAKTA